jgi:hypothetical protein
LANAFFLKDCPADGRITYMMNSQALIIADAILFPTVFGILAWKESKKQKERDSLRNRLARPEASKDRKSSNDSVLG